MFKPVFLLLFFFVFISPVFAYSAESMIALDMDSGRVLYEQNATEEKLIASTTKIMTALVALEHMDMSTRITVDEEVLKAYGSAIYIEVGEVLSLKDLLYGLMLRSGNDAAIVIANAVGGSMGGFVELMNQKAYELGMSHTVFYNAHGLEENNGVGNISTAYDMAILMNYAMKNADFAVITGTMNYTAQSSFKTYHWTNKNRLLEEYEYAIGGKTGYTQKAKRTLVTAAKKDGKGIVIVTLNDGNDFNDHKNLYQVLFSKLELVHLFEKDHFTVPNLTSYQDDVLYLEKDVSILLTKEEKESLHINYEMYELEEYHSKDQVGVAHVLLGNEEVMQVKIYIEKKQKEKLGFFSKLFRWLPW